MPGITFVATATAVLARQRHARHRRRRPRDACIGRAAAEAAITRAHASDHRRARGRRGCDLDLLVPLCGARAAPDRGCSHAHGSQWRGRGWAATARSAALDAAGQAHDPGEGGALIGNDGRCRWRPGATPTAAASAGAGSTTTRRIGSNGRMTEWQGAVLLGAAGALPAAGATRNANAIALGEALAQIRDCGCRSATAHGQPGQLLLRRPLRLGRVRRHAAAAVRGGARSPTACPLGVGYAFAVRPRRSSATTTSRRRAEASAPALDSPTRTCPWPSQRLPRPVWIEHRSCSPKRERVCRGTRPPPASRRTPRR